MKHFNPANILLPKKNFDKWAVVACDQYTSEPEYWNDVEAIVGDEPSALHIILPEIYLSDDNSARINKPSTVGQNWRWRITKAQLNDALKTEMHEAARRYGRLNWDNEPEKKETTADKVES